MSNSKNKMGKDRFDLGFKNESFILPYNCRKGDVVLLEGPPGTFKKTLAINFLVKGLVERENVLLIELSDRPLFLPEAQNRISKKLCRTVRETLHINTLCQVMEDKPKAFKKEMNQILKKYEKLIKNHRKNTNFNNLMRQFTKVRGSLPDSHQYNNIHDNEDIDKVRQNTYNNVLFAKQDRPVVKQKSKYSRQDFAYNRLSRFTEIAFKSGYVLPEEFIQTIRDTLLTAESEKHPITRIVFSNVGLLGVSYPLLKYSKTAGDLFLTAFVHIIRNYRDISLLMTGATEQYSQADEIISRARALADTVLKCSFCDVFGNRYVVIEGEGLTINPDKDLDNDQEEQDVSTQREYGEYTPGVIVPHEHQGKMSTFEVDIKRLEGLVGFDTGQLHRPGIIFYTFEEGDSHARYNDNIRKLLRYTFGISNPTLKSDGHHGQNGVQETAPARESGNPVLNPIDVTVNVEPFSSYDSEALHSSLNQFGGQPLDKTIVNTVDEFYREPEDKPGENTEQTEDLAQSAFINLGNAQEGLIEAFKDFEKKDKPHHIWPYYSNVLLLAYRTKDDNGNEIKIRGKSVERQKFRSWTDVLNFARSLSTKLKKAADSDSTIQYSLFDYYHYVDETRSCLLLDVLASGSNTKKNTKKRQSSDYWKKLLCADKLSEKQLEELLALQELLVASELARETPFLEYQTLQQEKLLIKKNAAVYLCWFSQLTELFKQDINLPGSLKVVALPGGGFRGDWYIGVSRGSVSNELGKQLVRMLCSEREQYKRFAFGVGLPTLQSFNEPKHKYFSWPLGEHVSVTQLYKIHNEANSRRQIPDYNNFRSTLALICKQLIRPDYQQLKEKQLKQKIKGNAGRLFTQIKMFSDKYVGK